MSTLPRPGPHQAVYVISVAAELAGMHPQTLRIYERRGLVDPARTTGGNRRYSEADIALLLRIARLTEEGLNLAGVKRVLALEAEVARLAAELATTRSEGGYESQVSGFLLFLIHHKIYLCTVPVGLKAIGI